MADQLFILDDQQLRQLARIIYNQEVEAIKNIRFSSEYELAKYLRDSKAAYDTVESILDTAGELKGKFKDDETRASIAHNIFSYTVDFSNIALQGVQNYNLRLGYLDKISKHAGEVSQKLEMLETFDPIKARELAEEAIEFKKAAEDAMRCQQRITSRGFSELIKGKGMTFEKLVERSQVKLKLNGKFENLKDAEKIKVYNEIIKESGRGNVFEGWLSKLGRYGGMAVILFTAGFMVWDIYSSEHKIETATRDAVMGLSVVGGATAGQFLAAGMVRLAGVEQSALFLFGTGLICSIAGIFILGEFAGHFVDLIFSSGGSAPLSTEGLHCYLAPMPDARVLARQIAHKKVDLVTN